MGSGGRTDQLRATAGENAGCRGSVVDALDHSTNVAEANTADAHAHALLEVRRHEGKPQLLRCGTTKGVRNQEKRN